jgi:hypothetical protein
MKKKEIFLWKPRSAKRKKLFLIVETEAENSIAPYSLPFTHQIHRTNQSISYPSDGDLFGPPSLILTSPPLTQMGFLQ